MYLRMREWEVEEDLRKIYFISPILAEVYNFVLFTIFSILHLISVHTLASLQMGELSKICERMLSILICFLIRIYSDRKLQKGKEKWFSSLLLQLLCHNSPLQWTFQYNRSG